MKICITYASSEGQTRKIARHVADRLADTGHAVELLPMADAGDLDLARFDRLIAAASLHAGHYQKALAGFVTAQGAGLKGLPTLFLSVSLAAAGHDAEDWKALDNILAEMKEATDWSPSEVEQVAGAYKPSQYNIIERLVMRRIVAKKDPDADLDADREYTDWPALDAVVDGWLAR